MRPSPEADAPTISGPIQSIIDRFEDTWRRALAGGPRPDVESFLADVPPGDRGTIRSHLERVDKEYSGRVSTAGATVDLPTVATADTGCLLPGPTPADNAAGRPDTHPEIDLTLDSNAETMDRPAGPPAQGKGAQLVAGYEILGELGRGGMGVVYKARQMGLNRVVALKMVLTGAHASKQQLDRFCLEAEAVARLQHPNIVQIYEVGERDGLPFFSLEYVDGGSLSDLIAKKPQSPKAAAQMAAMLARGVQYAHAHGIMHRDLKPHNVLMTTNGVPKITDFGLAKKLEDGAHSQTQTGTIVGTPSYMPPEQARGDVHVIGPAADIYSLGAILYEMITGRPPFLGSTLLETLEQVRSKEPVAPGQLVPKVPRDLETICLKCLQKEPVKRYGTAGDLADDLDRFLAGRPILARPIGGVERLVRWCKRNPRTAALTTIAVASLVTGTVVSAALAIGMARERNQKEEERARADEARVAAEVAQVEAQRNANEALEQGKLSLRAFGSLIDQVQREIGDNPGMQPLKLKLLEVALDGLDKVAKSDEDARLLGQSMASAYLQIAKLYQQLGETQKALTQCLKSHKIAQLLYDRDPDGPIAQTNLAAPLITLGELALEMHRDIQAALKHYQQALDLLKAAAANDLGVKVRWDLAEAYTRVGVIYLRLGDPEQAAGYFAEALSIREALARADEKNLPLQVVVAKSHNALGEVKFRARDWPAAREQFGKALAICERVHQAEPKSPTYRLELAHTLGNAGMFALRTGDIPAARGHLPRCQGLMAELAALDKKNANYQRFLALADYRCGILAHRDGDSTAADRWDRDCLEIRMVLADKSKNIRRQIELLLVRSRTDDHRAVADEVARMVATPNLDREVLVEMAQCYSQMAGRETGDALLRQQFLDRAMDLLRRAIQQGYKDRVLLETDPDLDAVRDQPEFKSLFPKKVEEPGA